MSFSRPLKTNARGDQLICFTSPRHISYMPKCASSLSKA